MRDPIVLERRLSDVLAGMFVGAGLMLFLNGAPFLGLLVLIAAAVIGVFGVRRTWAGARRRAQTLRRAVRSKGRMSTSLVSDGATSAHGKPPP